MRRQEGVGHIENDQWIWIITTLCEEGAVIIPFGKEMETGQVDVTRIT